MFFCISRQKEKNFPNHYVFGDLVISTDAGWTLYQQDSIILLYKGYLDQEPIQNKLNDIIRKKNLDGNYCAFLCNKSDLTITVLHSKLRSFPMTYNASSVTNLTKLEHAVYADQRLVIDKNLQTQVKRIPVIDNDIIKHHKNNTVINVVENIHSILAEKVKNFVEYQDQPIKIFASGGIDTTKLLSFLKSYPEKYEIVNCQHIDLDYFYCHNHATISKYTTYKYFHHWLEPTVIASGRPGDEFTLRGNGLLADVICSHYGVDLLELLQDYRYSGMLHIDFLTRPHFIENIKLFRKTEKFYRCVDNPELFRWTIFNMITNDFQGWHIGNTLTWTPLRDLHITQELLSLPFENLIKQILDSDVSKKIIQTQDPECATLLGNNKNQDNYLYSVGDTFFAKDVSITQL